MKKILVLILTFFISTAVNAKDLSEFFNDLIPGEGLTEASVEIRDHEKPDFNILAVRDIDLQESSNLFTQFGIHNSEVMNDERLIGNLGIGYRSLNDGKTMMYGVNAFYDRDLTEGHQRASIGFELRGKVVDFNFNQYVKLTNQRIISGTKEQVLSGREYNLTTQVPFTPWANFNLQGYNHDNELAANNQKGRIYSLEMALTPSIQFDISEDHSSVSGVEDVQTAKLTYVYPPRENKTSLQDGVSSSQMFVAGNVEDKLKEKVRRNNNLVVEIQGAVIFTKK